MKRLALIMFALASVQAQTTTSIVDTLYNADGTLWTGTITITRDALRACPQGQQPRFSTVRTISAGVINLSLFPNLQPSCKAVDGGRNGYRAAFAGTNGATWTEWWGVPSSGSAIPLSKIQLGGAPPYEPLSVAPSQIQTQGQDAGKTLIINSGGYVDWATPDSCPTCPRLTIQAGAPTGSCTAGYMVWDISTLPLITQFGCDNTQTWKQLGTRLIMQSGAPTGACTPSTTAWDISTDPITQYGCNSGGTWQELGSSGAGAYTGGDGIEIVDTTISADPLTLVQYVTSAGAPTGACTDGTLAFDAAAEQSYACINSAWVLISSTGATGGGYSQAFTSQTAVDLTHNLGTDAVVVSCFDAGEQAVEWDTLTITGTQSVAVTFATAQTGRCVVSAGGGGSGGSGTGDVVGPSSSTDNAAARYNGTGGKTLQNSLMTIDDTGSVNIPTAQTYNIAGSPHGHAISEVVNLQSGLDGKQAADAALTALSTGSDFVVLTGPSGSNKSFTLPDANATILTTASAVSVAQGGTGATDAATARTNLGLVIGSAVQAYSSLLATVAGLATTDDGVMVFNGSTVQLKILPDCSNGTTSKLLYTAASNAFSCGTDQAGEAGSGITSLGGLVAATQTFANDTNVTIASATSTHTLGWSGQLAVARGGTGAATLTGILQGNGTSAVSAITNSSTVGLPLTVTGSSTYAWSALDLANANATTGILGAAKGGTGNGFFAVSGPTTSTKTFTFPNASATVLTSNAAVTVAQGGTGITSGTSGGVPYFSSTSAVSSSAALTSNAVVIGGGAGAAPSTISASTTTTHALFATAGAPAFRALVDGDIPDTITASNYLLLAGGTVTGNLTVQGDLISGDGTDAGEIVLQELAASGSNFRSWKVPDTLTADWTLQFPNAVATATESLLTFPAPTTGVSAMTIKEVTATNTASTVVARDGSGNFAAGTITAALTGTASLATALAANGANCSAGQFPLGVNASGAVENCTALPTTISGTSNEVAASASTGAITLSLPSVLDLGGKSVEIPNSASLPGTCTVGQIYMDSDASPPGQQVYVCSSTNTWSIIGDGTGSGSFGETSLAGLVNSQTLWDSSQATRTLTAGLSGATDPVITFGNSLVNISTGDLQIAGNPVLSATSTTVGQIPRTTGTNTWAWGALDLADTDAVTGVLPDANVASTIARDSEVAAAYQPLDAALTALASGSDFVQFTGPTSTTKVMTLPNAAATLSYTVASGTSALGTSSIASGACATVVTTAATGTATTDIITWTPNADITAVTGYAPVTTGGLAIYPYPTANNVNWKVCNPTASSITPGAVTLNWKVIR